MSNSPEFTEKEISYGDHGKNFVNSLRTSLKRGDLKEKYIKLITSSECMKIYSTAFTSETADSKNNNQILKKIGEYTLKASIVLYITRRFPQINCSKGVPIISDLQKDVMSKKSYDIFSSKLGFWPFITASLEEKDKYKDELLKNIFQSFIGATSKIIDEKIRIGAGYAICYKIIKSLFDEIEINLEYTQIVDPITRLKNFFEKKEIKSSVGIITFGNPEKIQIEEAFFSKIFISLKKPGQVKDIIIGEGISYNQQEAKQKAAQNALNYLKKENIKEIVPDVYLNLCF